MNTDMLFDALEHALNSQSMPKNVIHHSDREVQYLLICYAWRLETADWRAFTGTTGGSYENAQAETVRGLYKKEGIQYLKSDWLGLVEVELTALNWIGWFNKKRLHSSIGYVSPFEFENMYYDKINTLHCVA